MPDMQIEEKKLDDLGGSTAGASTAGASTAGGCGKAGGCGCATGGEKKQAGAGNGVRKIWEIRTEEQAYAFLSDKEIKDTNRYGQKIDLIELTEHKLPAGRSL